MLNYLFLALAALTVISGLMVVFARSPIYSVLSLVVCFFSISGHYVLLSAHFLAAVNLIVYAGAIMVLFLFVIMLLDLHSGREIGKSVAMIIAGIVTGGMLLIVLLMAFNSPQFLFPEMTTVNASIGEVKNLGLTLFRDYLLPFEITSVLFLSAMAGAVLLAKKSG